MIVSVYRRYCLAFAALAMAWIFLHPYVADALCLRGDEYLRAGDPRTAEVYYHRAVAIDRDSESAVDRFAFTSLEIRTSRDLGAGIDAANAYLVRHPSALRVRLDRVLVLFALGRKAQAERDLRILAAALGDARYLKLADAASRAVR